MSDEVLVRVENVSKRFCLSLKRSLWYGLQDLGSELGGRRHGGGSGLPQSSADVQLRTDEFWAVKDVSFELRRGECLGLIGRNGAGKTTLLRMLNGLIKPDTGSIEMMGKVGALIALGAGFNPQLTGRENIKINASILGLSDQETQKQIGSIIDFSEIEDFIDTPVQSYSSGMQVRLGFGIATALYPDILILDEVLAVGDAVFRQKCNQRISELRSQCATIVVSHHEGELRRICESGLFLQQGSCLGKQEIGVAYKQYSDSLKTAKISPKSTTNKEKFLSSFKNLDFKIALMDEGVITSTSCLNIQITFRLPCDVEISTGLINFLDDFDDVHATLPLHQLRYIPKGLSKVKIQAGPIMLCTGKYNLHLYIDTKNHGLLVSSLRSLTIDVAEGFPNTYSSHVIEALAVTL